MFESLYKRAKTGKIVSYEIIVQPGTPNGGSAVIRKYTGQLEGKKTCHEEQVTVGKQGRSINEQAVFMATSDWKKKKDEGYKSLADLGYTGPRFATPAALYRNLEELVPKTNTDASGNAKPMLAHEFHKHKKKVTYPCYIQPKLDGVRCLMIVNPYMNTVKFLSRTGKEYTSLNHIAMDVKAFYQHKGSAEGFILDGEIYSDELGFQDIVSAVKAYKPNSLKLKFRCYDIINDETQEERIETVCNLVESIDSTNIQIVETFKVNDEDAIRNFFSQWVAEGYEGAMVRLLDGKYESGARSHSLLKYKEFDDAEFHFVKFEKGAREEDLIANCLTDTLKPFKAKMMGTVEQKEKLYEEFLDCKYEASKVTIKFFGWTDDGLPRIPIGKSIRDYE